MEPIPRPKRYYFIFIVGSCFLTLFMLWGMVVNSFAIFFKPIAEDMGWSRAAVSTALFTRSIGTALSAPIAGRLIDRIGAKPVMAAGTIIIGIGLLGASRVTTLWQYYSIFAVIGVGLMCATVIPCSLIIANWFIGRRGAAMSAAFVGTSVGGMVMSPVANWIILNYSWRAAFALNGILILILVAPVILLVIRDHPSDIGLEPYRNAGHGGDTAGADWGVGVREAFSLRAFWLIAAIMFIIGFATNGVHTHAVAYLTDLGHSPTSSAYAWSLVMVIMVAGKLAFGPIADRWGAPKAAAADFALYALSILALSFARPYGIAIAFACLYGFACGGPLTLNPLLTGGSLGMRNFGAIYGILTIMASVGGAISPVIAGAYFDSHGTYLPVFFVFMILMLLGAVCAIRIRPASQQPGGTRQI